MGTAAAGTSLAIPSWHRFGERYLSVSSIRNGLADDPQLSLQLAASTACTERLGDGGEDKATGR